MPIPSPVTSSRANLILQERARGEHIALVYRLLPSGILATLGVASLLGWGLMGHVPHAWLYGWFASVIGVSAVRLWGLRAWRHSAAPAAAHWVRYFFLGAASAGFTWGAAGFLLFPADSSAQLLMTFALAGMAAGA